MDSILNTNKQCTRRLNRIQLINNKNWQIAANDIFSLNSLTLPDRPYQFAYANKFDELEKAAQLVKKRYLSRGYGSASGQMLNAGTRTNQMTLIAANDANILGTVSSRFDGETRLNCESLFPDIVKQKRLSGHRLIEFGQFAIDNPDSQLDVMEIMGPFFHLTLIFAQIQIEPTHALIEVNPRHVRFYQHLFGFSVLTEERICERVNAPAILMEVDLREVQLKINELGGRRCGRRSIYPYCFSASEKQLVQKEILSRLFKNSFERPEPFLQTDKLSV